MNMAGPPDVSHRDKLQKSLDELSPEARRALAEAAERRRQEERKARPDEIGGRGGLDPVRYGDWEVKGIASDF